MSEQARIRRILVATDFSPGAKGALNWAKGLAAAFQAEVVLLHVFDLTRFPPHLSRVPDGERLVQQFRLEVKKEMEAFGKQHPGMRPLLREGAPRAIILEVADELKADLIVMGTHGHTGLTHVLVGSVAEHVVRHSRIPVLTVRQIGD